MSLPEISSSQMLQPTIQTQQSQQSDQSVGGQAQLASKTNNPQSAQNTGIAPIDAAKLQKGIEKLNEILAPNQTKVEMAQNAPPNQVWLNVIDSTTGQVLEKLPPEGLREFMETHDAKGLAMDLRL
jgi:uncharacterized FlaG/YvyC family protein